MLAELEVLRRLRRYMFTRSPPIGQCHIVGPLARVSNVVFILTNHFALLLIFSSSESTLGFAIRCVNLVQWQVQRS